MTTTLNRQTRISNLTTALVTDAGLLALDQITNLAGHRAHGTGPAHTRYCQLRRLCADVRAYRRAAFESQDTTAYRAQIESRIAAFQVGPVAALPEAIEAQESEEPHAGYEEPVTEADAPEEEPRKRRIVAPATDDLTYWRRRCFALAAERGLSNDSRAMRTGFRMMPYGRPVVSRAEMTVDEWRSLACSIEGGTFYASEDGRSWCKRVPVRVARMMERRAA